MFFVLDISIKTLLINYIISLNKYFSIKRSYFLCGNWRVNFNRMAHLFSHKRRHTIFFHIIDSIRRPKEARRNASGALARQLRIKWLITRWIIVIIPLIVYFGLSKSNYLYQLKNERWWLQEKQKATFRFRVIWMTYFFFRVLLIFIPFVFIVIIWTNNRSHLI